MGLVNAIFKAAVEEVDCGRCVTIERDEESGERIEMPTPRGEPCRSKDGYPLIGCFHRVKSYREKIGEETWHRLIEESGPKRTPKQSWRKK